MLHCSQCSPEIISFQIVFCSLKKIHFNFTTNLQSLLYIYPVLSGCVDRNRKFPCGNSLIWYKTLTHYHRHTMSKWGQSDKYIAAWIHHISNKMIQAPGLPPFLTLYHALTLEAFNCPTKTIVPKIIAHSWIPSHRNFFITLTCCMWVLYIATN